MEVLIIFALVVLGVGWLVSPFIIMARLSGIARDIQSLRAMLRWCWQNASNATTTAVAPQPIAEPVHTEWIRLDEVKPEAPAPGAQPVEARPQGEALHVPQMPPPQKPLPEVKVCRPQPVPEPTESDLFWSKIGDWLAVRGDFAPAGMTREFAIATRWLVRTGTAILVGAIAYFMMLAIDRGWIGPAQRVYGMMFCGAAGIVAGAWIKLKREKYAILGEGAVALGLVALYLSFGLGHRFFDPPVIGSYAVTFCGLAAVTVLAGLLSVKLGSLPIAVLGLVGGLLAPIIVRVGTAPVKLDVYLLMLAFGACAVAHVRRWTAYGLVAIAAVFMVFLHHDINHGGMVNGVFMSILYLLVPALALAGSSRRSQAGNQLCWAFVAASAIVWSIAMSNCCFVSMGSMSVGSVLTVAAAVHAVLAGMCRDRREQVGNGVSVVICLAVGFAAFALLMFLHGHERWRLLSFCLFAAALGELRVRSGEKVFGPLVLLVSVACAAEWMFVSAPASYETIARDGYGRALLVRSVRLWCVPALAAFLGGRLNEETTGSSSERTVCHFFAFFMGLTLLTCESHWFGKLFLPELKGGTVTIAWAVVALAFLSAGIVYRRRSSRLAGLWVLAAAVAKLLLLDTASLPTSSRVGVFGLVGVVLIACAFLYLKFKSKFEER